MFFFRDGNHEKVLGVWLNPGDCVCFSSHLRYRWTHGVWRYWREGQDPDAALSSENPHDARIVLNVRHGLVTQRKQYDWYDYWAEEFPMDVMSEKHVKVLEHLQKSFGKFKSGASDEDLGDEEQFEHEDLKAVAQSKEWKPFLHDGKKWKGARLTRVWDVERVVEVCR